VIDVPIGRVYRLCPLLHSPRYGTMSKARPLPVLPRWLAVLGIAGIGVIFLQTYVDLLPLPLPPHVEEIMWWIGHGVLVLGSLLYLWPIAVRRLTYRSAGTDPKKVRGHYLCVTGPYGVVRHPAYTGIMLMVVGIEVIASSWLVFVIPPICVALLVKAARIEERDLSRMYRHVHETYRRRVPWLFVPYIY
jgi:protein-S-isoprenylcysteine O-methyltransferase Ste14